MTIQPNLAAWLKTYPLDKGPIILGNFKKRRDRFAKKFDLTHDVLRHTFISMFVAKFRSIGEAAIQAGNSEAIIRKHYLDLKTTKEAESFYGIMPKHAKVSSAPSAATLAHIRTRLKCWRADEPPPRLQAAPRWSIPARCFRFQTKRHVLSHADGTSAK